jgi:LuxR family transcriptional regulator, quorum-sensing system regulator SdiA
MSRRAIIAALLHQLDERSPAGFAIALHIQFTTPTYMFQTYPRRWLDHYTASGMVLHDPVVRWGMQNAGRTRWSELEAMDAGGVMEEARNFGLMNGAAVAFVSAGTRSIGGFARADREYYDAEMEELEALLFELHMATLVTNRLSATDQRALTELSIKLTR